MLGKLIRNSEIRQLASFVSPSFFDVMPARALWSHAKQLRQRSRDPGAFRHAAVRRRTSLAKSGLFIELQPEDEAEPRPRGQEPGKQDRAERIVALYFHQLFWDGPVLLDLRGAAFTPVDERLVWRPAHWIASFEPDFIEPLRDVYRGFYSDDDAVFRSGLEALRLTKAEDLFREHFGENQSGVRFVVADFISTFHQVFVRCREANVTLHPDFLDLGIYLAALYEHLEPLGVEVDVAKCFHRAQDAREEGVAHAG